MGRFNDLPKDVKWLVFREAILGKINSPVWVWEHPYYYANSFSTHCSFLMSQLSVLDKSTLKLIRTKCFKYRNGWIFCEGALT